MLRLLPALLVLALPAAAAAQVRFLEGPSQGRLYPRDPVTNQAEVAMRGEVTVPGFVTASLLVMRDGAIWQIDQQSLTYSNGVAPFSFSTTIEAGLHRYRFRFLLSDGFSSDTYALVGDVVCGDAFLVQGQSNAVAADVHGEHRANDAQSTWVRSYGTARPTAAAAAANHEWYVADGEGQNDRGTIGAWALRLGKNLVDRYQVPVAILNGALGATPIRWHLRDDADPENLNTIYGRLLHRARAAGLAERVRALFWYQGETNGAMDGLEYFRLWSSLRRDWLEDYPGLERIYVFQIHNGTCGGKAIEVREAQRRLADWFPEVEVMSTSAAPGHDGCHYWYEGYEELGRRITRLVARDLYGEPAAAAFDPPNVWQARFTGPARDQIRIVGRDRRQFLTIDPLAYRWFELDAPERVIGVVQDGADLLLQLSGPTTAATVAWVGHPGDGAWITNSLGVGLLAFRLPIQP